MENIITLGMLVLLQAVLGFDNLLYISLESKRAPLEKQAMIRRTGIGIAIVLRIILLFVLLNVIQYFQEVFWSLNILDGNFIAEITGHSLIVLGGGIFIMYTAIKEIFHMMHLSEDEESEMEKRKASPAKVIAWIVIMNLVFSFDSILSAMALSKVFWVMATAIVISGVLMIWLANTVSEFLQKNRMYEVLGLFILFVVGIMLITEGAHLCHMTIVGNEIHAMSKTTFYFVIGIMILIDIVQGRYQKKLMMKKGR